MSVNMIVKKEENVMQMFKRLIIPIIVVLFLFSCSKESNDFTNGSGDKGDWPKYRGDNGNTGFSNSKAPESNPTDLSENLSTDFNYIVGLGTGFTGTPLVADGILLAVAAGNFFSPNDKLTAFDLKTSDLKWSFSSEYGFSNLAISNGVVFFGFNDKLFALDIYTGQKKWEITPSQGIDFSPSVSDGMVFFEGGEFIYAVDENSGQERWKFNKGSSNYSFYINDSPPTTENLVFISGCENCIVDYGLSALNFLYAIDKYTGQEKWKYKTEKGWHSMKAVANQTVFFTTVRDGGSSYRYAIDINTGLEKWKLEVDDNVGVESNPAVAYETVFFTTSYPSYLYAYDVKTGNQKWKVSVGGNYQDNSPAVANNMIFIGGGTDNYLYALDVATGLEKWKYGNEYGKYPIFDGPIIANNLVIYIQDGRIHVLK